MAKVDVRRDLDVTLTLDEEEALFVLAALGMTTGRRSANSSVYSDLFNALRDAGFGKDFLFEQEVDVIPS